MPEELKLLLVFGGLFILIALFGGHNNDDEGGFDD